MAKHIFVGGLLAAGFDASGEYLLVVSHAGRGVFATANWERIARDTDLVYPENGQVLGIGPLGGSEISVAEVDYNKEGFEMASPDKRFRLRYKEGALSVFPGNA